MKLTIHQPNLIPWIPFFEKMKEADVFVILGHCQFEKGGFQNRFKHKDFWNTLSVSRGIDTIVNKRYTNYHYDWIKIAKRLGISDYLKDEIGSLLSESLYQTNYNLIKLIAKRLNIKTKIVSDYNTNKLGTYRIIDICKHYEATEYISGPSGSKYLNLTLFENIKVSFFKSFETRNVLSLLT